MLLGLNQKVYPPSRDMNSSLSWMPLYSREVPPALLTYRHPLRINNPFRRLIKPQKARKTVISVPSVLQLYRDTEDIDVTIEEMESPAGDPTVDVQSANGQVRLATRNSQIISLPSRTVRKILSISSGRTEAVFRCLIEIRYHPCKPGWKSRHLSLAKVNGRSRSTKSEADVCKTIH